MYIIDKEHNTSFLKHISTSCIFMDANRTININHNITFAQETHRSRKDENDKVICHYFTICCAHAPWLIS